MNILEYKNQISKLIYYLRQICTTPELQNIIGRVKIVGYYFSF